VPAENSATASNAIRISCLIFRRWNQKPATRNQQPFTVIVYSKEIL
jgi:hypothetical protein